MAIQITSILCEGPHDVAFIARILKTMGFKSNEGTKLGEFPLPINKLFEIEAKKANVTDLNLVQVRQTLLPIHTLNKNDDYLFLYSMGGDGQKAARNKMLNEFISLVPKEGEYSITPIDTTLSIIYFFDADDKGLSSRLSNLNQEIEEGLGVKLFTLDKQIYEFNGVKIGYFIFTGDDNNTGKLENILIPMMKKDNETIFDNAQTFLTNNHEPTRIYPLKIKPQVDGTVLERRSTKSKDCEYDAEKSLIGIAGQLQRSGKQNTVFITDCDYITLSKIQSNPKCIEIIDFFNDFLTT